MTSPTDIPGLVERLRYAHSSSVQRFSGSRIFDEAATALSAQQREIAGLREALEPFVREANAWEMSLVPPDAHPGICELDGHQSEAEFTFADLARAAAALNTPSQEGEKR